MHVPQTDTRRRFLQASAGVVGAATMWSGFANADTEVTWHQYHCVLDGYWTGWAIFAADVYYDFEVWVHKDFEKEHAERIRRAMILHFTKRTALSSLAEEAARVAKKNRPQGISDDRNATKGAIEAAVRGSAWHWDSLLGSLSSYLPADDSEPGRPVMFDGKPFSVNGKPPARAALIPAWSQGKPAKLIVDRLPASEEEMADDGVVTLGRAQLNLIRPNEAEHVFRISLNGLHMPGDPKRVGETIIHECLHNLGYSHSDFGDADYDEYFINVFDRIYASSSSIPIAYPEYRWRPTEDEFKTDEMPVRWRCGMRM